LTISSLIKHRNEVYSINSLSNGLSDDDAQILTLNNCKCLNSHNYIVYTRDINEFTKSEFKLHLNCEMRTDVFTTEDDVDLMFNNFLNTYLIIFNHNLPYKKHSSKQYNKTWLTNGIRTSCARKRELLCA
jgi:hypothetical protein